MSKSVFHTGGFVLHGIRLCGEKYSAWFDRRGKMLDCEKTTGGGEQTVKKTVTREQLQRIGLAHVG